LLLIVAPLRSTGGIFGSFDSYFSAANKNIFIPPTEGLQLSLIWLKRFGVQSWYWTTASGIANSVVQRLHPSCRSRWASVEFLFSSKNLKIAVHLWYSFNAAIIKKRCSECSLLHCTIAVYWQYSLTVRCFLFSCIQWSKNTASSEMATKCFTAVNNSHLPHDIIARHLYACTSKIFDQIKNYFSR